MFSLNAECASPVCAIHWSRGGPAPIRSHIPEENWHPFPGIHCFPTAPQLDMEIHAPLLDPRWGSGWLVPLQVCLWSHSDSEFMDAKTSSCPANSVSPQASRTWLLQAFFPSSFRGGAWICHLELSYDCLSVCINCHVQHRETSLPGVGNKDKNLGGRLLPCLWSRKMRMRCSPYRAYDLSRHTFLVHLTVLDMSFIVWNLF